jgi:membrane protein
MWSRLNALDFINQGMLFAAVLLLCFVPFMIVLQALRGQAGASGLIRRFGLDASATAAVRHALTSSSDTSSSVTGASWVFFVLGGIAGATAIQELYERVFDEKSRGLRDLPRRVLWLMAAIAFGGFAAWSQPWLHSAGGPVLLGAVALVTATAFWWFSMWLMLGGRRTWAELLPAALATGVCWLGMTIVFRLTLSDTITSDYKKYGDIGVVFAIMSLLIAIGVVLIIGAVFGEVWRERRGSVVVPQQGGDRAV